MTRWILASLPLLALAACNKAPDEPKTVEQATAEMKDSAVKMLPGKWQTTVEIVKFDIPGAPPEAKQMMQGAMAANTVEACVTQAEVDKGPNDFFKNMQDGNCSFSRFNVAGGTVDAAMSCTGSKMGGEVNATMNGVMTPESSAVKVNSVITGSQMPGGKIEMETKVTSKRVGDCA